MKALVGAFNQEKALVGAFSVIVKTGCGIDGCPLANLYHPQDPLKALLQPTELAHPAVRDKHHRDIVVNVLDCFLDLLSHK